MPSGSVEDGLQSRRMLSRDDAIVGAILGTAVADAFGLP
jgi:hypothetical protein